MISGLICVGDRTTHGGTVITGDATSIIGNRAVARAGDMTICPKCKGTFPILAGNGIITAPNGVPYPRHMDRSACGARLLASQDTTLASDMETPETAVFIWLLPGLSNQGGYGRRGNRRPRQLIVKFPYLCADAPQMAADGQIRAYLFKRGATPERRLDDLSAVMKLVFKENG